MNNAEVAFEKLTALVGTSLEAIKICKTELAEQDHEELFCNMLDDIYGEIGICGLSYSAGYAFREVDPVAFQCGLADHLANNAIELGNYYFYDYQILELVERLEMDKAFGHERKEA